jgi:sec-independent protein translocase protein TatC
MLLTPSDPASMMMMMVPLVILYELGIILCGWHLVKRPSELQAEA